MSLFYDEISIPRFNGIIFERAIPTPVPGRIIHPKYEDGRRTGRDYFINVNEKVWGPYKNPEAISDAPPLFSNFTGKYYSSIIVVDKMERKLPELTYDLNPLPVRDVTGYPSYSFVEGKLNMSYRVKDSVKVLQEYSDCRFPEIKAEGTVRSLVESAMQSVSERMLWSGKWEYYAIACSNLASSAYNMKRVLAENLHCNIPWMDTDEYSISCSIKASEPRKIEIGDIPPYFIRRPEYSKFFSRDNVPLGIGNGNTFTW